MEDIIDVFAHAPTGLEIPDITLDESKVLPRVGTYQAPHFLEVLGFPGRQVVQANDSLVQAEQILHKMRADKAGSPGNQPPFGGFF